MESKETAHGINSGRGLWPPQSRIDLLIRSGEEPRNHSCELSNAPEWLVGSSPMFSKGGQDGGLEYILPKCHQ